MLPAVQALLEVERDEAERTTMTFHSEFGALRPSVLTQ
jgi:hypothetical protein